jgi:hypothetical protein
VTYGILQSSNRLQGKDLVRYADRNLLAVTPELPVPQRLLSGVRDVTFSFYDGSQWRQFWDTTTDTNLPRGIKVEIQMLPDISDRSGFLPPPLQLVVPVMVSNVTNSITSTNGTTL